jgi:two-component system chemotaxis sensor kinase CheA
MAAQSTYFQSLVRSQVMRTPRVTLVLSTIDRIKSILDAIELSEGEPAGDNADLIGELNRFTASQRTTPPASRIGVAPSRSAAPVDGETVGPPAAQEKLSAEKSWTALAQQ